MFRHGSRIGAASRLVRDDSEGLGKVAPVAIAARPC